MSVVMAVRAPDPAFLAAAVDSALAQELAAVELIVVEDGDPPRARELVAARGDPRLRWEAGPGDGLAAARNRGLERSRAAYVAILDGDDVCEPGRLVEQAAFLDAHPDVAVVGCHIEAIDAAGAAVGVRRYPLDDAAIRRALRRFNPIAHPGVMLRREVVLAAGGYRAGAGACDDYELWSRLAQSGVRFANLDRVLLRYRLHGGAMKRRALRQTLRDTLRVKRTHWRGELDLGDRARMLGEGALLLVPAPLTAWLFRRLTYRGRR